MQDELGTAYGFSVQKSSVQKVMKTCWKEIEAHLKEQPSAKPGTMNNRINTYTTGL